MDYEKKYKEALGNARQEYNTTKNVERKQWLEELFPELKENWNEKIRKEILEYFQQFENEELRGVNISDWIFWLEKQQKPAWSEEDMFKVQRICKYLNEAKKYYADITEVRECMDWLKSLKQRIGG